MMVMQYEENVVECFMAVILDMRLPTLEFKREREVCQVRGNLSNTRPRPVLPILSSVVLSFASFLWQLD